MITRTWYLGRLSKALNTLHMDAASAVLTGGYHSGPLYLARGEGISRSLRDEVDWVLENTDDLDDLTANLETFVDMLLKSWESSIDSNLPYRLSVAL